MSEESYHLHNTAPLRAICNINVKTASGTNLEPLGIAECNFRLGTTTYVQPFIVCRKLTRNFILGRDFLRTNRLHVGWSNERRFRVQSGKEILIEAISVETQPVVTMKKNITVPPRTLVVVEMQTVIPSLEGVGYYDFMPNERYGNQEVYLVLIPVAYYTTTAAKTATIASNNKPRRSSYQSIGGYCYGSLTRSQGSGQIHTDPKYT